MAQVVSMNGIGLTKRSILILEHGADSGLKDYAGRTAIDEARAREDEEALNLLLKYSDRQ